MRIAVISDIHGNQIALEEVLHDLGQQPDIDQVVIAGDLCLNGPRPRQVLEIIRGLSCPVIQGNVDIEVVNGAPGKGAKKRTTVSWTREEIGEANIKYLAGLPFSHRIANPDGSDLLIVHANPLNQDDAIMPNAPDSVLEQFLGGLKEDIGALAFGHLHIAYKRNWRHLLLGDIASCGLPRDEDLRAAYGIFTWKDGAWEVEIRRVAYDVKEMVKQIKTCGMPNVEKRVRMLLEARY
jgi:predicted phosphodiesterase